MTQVELVAVVAVVALTVAVMLPPLAKSREVARRIQCQNNLRQLGVAIRSYHDTYGSLPPGYVLSENGAYLGWGWGVLIQPHLTDGLNYFQHVRYEQGLAHERANQWLTFGQSHFRCPSDRQAAVVEHALVVTSDVRDGEVVAGTVDATNLFSRSHYFGVAGYLPTRWEGVERDDDRVPDGAAVQMNAGSLGQTGPEFSPAHRYCDQRKFRGLFGQNSHVTFDEVKDGISNALMVGERASPWSSGPESIGHGTWIGVPDCSRAAGLAFCLGDTSVRLNSGRRDPSRTPETTGFGSSHFVGPSRVEGGHFLLADGSVKFFNSDISLDVYRDLSTIDDGRSIDAN